MGKRNKRKRAQKAQNFARKVLNSHKNKVNISSPVKGVEFHGIKGLKATIKDLKTRNCETIGKRILEWLLHDTNEEIFMSSIFERKSMLCRNNGSNRYEDIISSKQLISSIRTESLTLGRDFTLSLYDTNKRKRINAHGIPVSDIEAEYFRKSYSLRFLRPQDHFEDVSYLIAGLECFFNNIGGCNIYLTPSNSQGFAPHYDDVDVFILQIEGSKKWKAYEPISQVNEEGIEFYDPQFPKLPLSSSEDFSIEEVSESAHLKLVVDEVLEPGDFLYLPRGFVHYARTTTVDSLHLTLSINQRSSYGDVILKSIAQTLSQSQRLRESLPKDIFDTFGIMNMDDEKKNKVREILSNHLSTLLQAEVMKNLEFDNAVDEMYLKFMKHRQNIRPLLCLADEDLDDEERSKQILNKLNLDSTIRLTTDNAARLVQQENHIVVYHCLKNNSASSEKDFDLPGLEFEIEDAEMIEILLKSDVETDTFIVSQLPNTSDRDKLRVVQFLLQERILEIV